MKTVFRSIVLSIVLGLLFTPHVKAQSGFFFTYGVSSENVLPSLALGAIASGAIAISNSDAYDSVGEGIGTFVGNTLSLGLGSSLFPHRFYMFKENGKRPAMPGFWKSKFGGRAIDLFNDLKANIKFCWVGAYSPVGIYGQLGFRHQNIEMQLSQESAMSLYMFGTVRPGAGIRIAPGNLFDWKVRLEEEGISPFIDFGTTYNKIVYYNGPYKRDDMRVVSDGLSYNLSIGLSFIKRGSILLGLEWFPYDLFNRDLTFGEVRPFENLTSKQMIAFLSGEISF